MPKKVYKLHTDSQPKQLMIDYQNELNNEQYQVVEHGNGPCLVLAGAGSGKTRTLVYRVAYLLEQGIKPQNILLMTFTNKAAREMSTRVEQLLKYHPKGLWAGTFHHVGNRILRKYISKLGYDNNYTIMDQGDSHDLVKQLIGEVKKQQDKYFPKPRVLHSIISFATNSGKAIPDVVLQKYSYLDPALIELIEIIHNRYQTKKKELNLLDYDDLLKLWLQLLTEFPEIQKALSSSFQYILVDEYQDTNHLQAQVIEKLTQHHGNILVVGDDAQSIYSFRAADVSNILAFPTKFADANIFKLETNYRSTPEILALANQSINNNTEQFPKELRSVKAPGEKPILVAAMNTDEQAEFITQRILELSDEGTSLGRIAVLFRADYQALELELALNKKSIPYIKRGGLRFFEQAHLKDMVAFLRIANNYRDELSWTRVLLLLPGIGNVTANRLLTQVTNQPIEQLQNLEINIPAKAKRSWNELRTILTYMTDSNQSAGDKIQKVLDGFYDEYLKTTFDNADKRNEDITQLMNYADSFDSLDAMLSELALSENFSAEQIQGEEPDYDEQLVISTIHQAKGLEWDTVFVMHVASGQLPHARSMQSRAELEEERRLFYVACTRAERELYLSYPMTSYSHSEGMIFNQPSEFIQELSAKLYQEWSLDADAPSDDLPTIEYLPDVQ